MPVTTTTYEPGKGLTMTQYVHIEPAREQRRAFARWCLQQDPRIEAATASGSDVPVDLYPQVPEELLEGAHIDGYPYRPVIEGHEPHGDGYKPEQPDVPLTELRLPVGDKPKAAPRRSRKTSGQSKQSEGEK